MTYGGDDYDHIRDLKITSDSGYIITGLTHSFDSTIVNIWNLRLDSDGYILWEKLIDWSGQDYPYQWANSYSSAIELADDGFLLAGYADNFDGGLDTFFLKLSEDGEIIWKNIFAGQGGENYFYSISSTQDGGFLVTGLKNFIDGRILDSKILFIR